MPKTTSILHFKVIIERDEDGIYVGSIPELPGCYSQAKTIEALRKRMKEAIQLVLESDKDVRQAKLKSPPAASGFFGIEDLHIRYA